jgi:hypothetical protein
MKFDIEKSMLILQRTPGVLRTLLDGLDDAWTRSNEAPGTFSPFDVVGHLVYGEKADWRPRASIILEHGVSKPFEPYDRFAQMHESHGKTIRELLKEFEKLRSKNLKWLKSLSISETDLDKKGLHPGLGEVTLRQLLSTWVVHDLTHIAQVTRVMAKQYKEEIGPWVEYFRIMNF